MHDAYISGRFRQTKITGKAGDMAENLQLFRAVWFFHPRLSCTTTHISVDVQRITLNVSCMTISGWRTKQFDIFCHVTGFTSDFLSFIFVEIIRFFHGALQLFDMLKFMCLRFLGPHPPDRVCNGGCEARISNSWTEVKDTRRSCCFKSVFHW